MGARPFGKGHRGIHNHSARPTGIGVTTIEKFLAKGRAGPVVWASVWLPAALTTDLGQGHRIRPAASGIAALEPEKNPPKSPLLARMQTNWNALWNSIALFHLSRP